MTGENTAGQVAADSRGPSGGQEEEPAYAGRRTFLKWVIGLGTGAFALAFGLPALALKTLQTERQTVAAGDMLVYAVGVSGGTVGQPIAITELEPGTAVQAFPKGKTDNQQNLIELVRVGSGTNPGDVVAYSAICTHLGCAVYARLNDQGQIACPCHASRFDPRDNAKVVGGPAPRPLPSLPLTINADGTIVAQGPFSGPIGPQ